MFKTIRKYQIWRVAALVPCGGTGQPDCNLCHLWQLASNVINFMIFDLAIPLAALLIVIAGIVFLASAGNDKRVELAKKIFTNVIIGLIIVLAAWLIIDTLLQTIASGAFSAAWNKFPSCPSQ